MLKTFFLNLKGLSDASVASLTKKEYGLAVHFLYILMKSLALISDEWFNAICWSSLLFGIFVIKKWVVFSLLSLGTLKYDYVTTIRETFKFLPLINNSVTIEFRFLLLIISATIKNYQYFTFFIYVVFVKIFINIMHIIWILNKSVRVIKVF